MPVIKPSRTFEGSSVGGPSNSTPYIREDVQRAIFNKSQNTNGAYIYFMPAYRLDSQGSGVWLKHLEIRDNFGDKYKEKYWVPVKHEDPADYFAKHFMKLYPGEEDTTTVAANGKTFKKYPNYGRTTKRVLFNVAFANNLAAGVHVLDLPQYNGASIITNWMSQMDISGKLRPMLNDPDAAYPVFVRLLDSGSNPWQINVDSSQPAILPESLTAQERLYNLDEILVQKPAHEIIAKLREMYSSDVFEDCMHGFPGLTTGHVQGHSLGAAQAARATAPKPTPAVAPAVVKPVPAESLQQTRPQPPVHAGVPINTVVPTKVEEPAHVDPSELPPNPMLSSSMTREQLQQFLANP
jgi:hypothetical protein